MGAATVQVSARIDADLKRGGDAVFSRFGLGPSEVIRGIWQYAVEKQAIPAFLEKSHSSAKWEDDGCGMATRVAQELCGFDATTAKASGAPQTPDAEKDALYDELLDQMEARCH